MLPLLATLCDSSRGTYTTSRVCGLCSASVLAQLSVVANTEVPRLVEHVDPVLREWAAVPVGLAQDATLGAYAAALAPPQQTGHNTRATSALH